MGFFDFLANYWLFFLKFLTVIFVLGGILLFILALRRQAKGMASLDSNKSGFEFIITSLHEEFAFYKEVLDEATHNRSERKRLKKQKKINKKKSKNMGRLFVLDFDGDTSASAAASLKEEISSILLSAKKGDEVLLRLESPGGAVNEYGFASLQLSRLKKAKIPLTISVDRVAASGGYMMAVVADKIIAAPFSFVGSIGVISVLPNFHRLLKKNDIDVNYQTAGEFKRTMTLFGDDSEEAKKKNKEEIQSIHEHFKAWILEHRPHLDLARIATGEAWLGKEAFSLGLVDELKLSDEYLMEYYEKGHEIYGVEYCIKKSLQSRFQNFSQKLTQQALSFFSKKTSL